MEEQFIYLSGLNLPDAQPNVIDLSGLNLPDAQSQPSNVISKPLGEIPQNLSSPADSVPGGDESDSNYSYSGPAPFDPFQGTLRTPEHSYPESIHQVLQDLWNRYLTGSSANSQAAAPEEQSLSHINMFGVFKQFAFGGIDAILQALWVASQAVDVPIPYEPYQSPFAPPANVYERTARLMGSFQLPALFGEAVGAGGEPDLFENGGDVPETRATFGQAATNDYRSTFFAEHPELRGKVVVHHAVEQRVLTKFPGVVTEEEMHSIENLRGIPIENNPDIHLRQIRREWNRFYEQNPNPSKEQLLQKASEIDAKYGSQFRPPLGGK